MITVVDYGLGNKRSVIKAFSVLGAEAESSSDPEKILSAEAIILPGVGAFGDGMKNLKEAGLIEPMTEAVLKNNTPFLGICLGMQLVAKDSNELGDFQGLGWIDSVVRKFEFGPENSNLKIPHIGWNEAKMNPECPLFEGLGDSANFYFVHSYHMICNDKSVEVATTDYGYSFTSAVQKDNLFATQFHPEKSQKAGLAVLKNFLNYVRK
ncbi:TPA: imidazole glycerol phosphate synthase subunit HisH [Candidatus Micrarchaeota archaeon]|nr:imidazole glycerol phosphate synthase subunit HisH [Candidatus Micrarchaeota archaeon]